MIFCHTGDNTELRVANPNLLPQSRRTDSATGLITCKFHRAFSILKILSLLSLLSLLMFIIKLTYGYFCKFTSYSRFLYIKSAPLSLDYRINLLRPCNRLRLTLHWSVYFGVDVVSHFMALSLALPLTIPAFASLS